jgi:glycosyltransferase involved in cell wall biosynthesis
MHIGFVPESSSVGGSYLYSRTLLEAACELQSQDIRLTVLLEAEDPGIRDLCGSTLPVRWLDPPAVRTRIKRVVGPLPFVDRALIAYRALRPKRQAPGPRPEPDRIRLSDERKKRLRKLGIELMIYGYPTAKSFETGLPFVMPIHDLQHRLQLEFPEVSAGGEWERREYLYRNACRYGLSLLADSGIGKEDILQLYGEYIGPDRVEVLPFPPIHRPRWDNRALAIARARATYGLPERYFFYPAQFWPHKNHLRIVRALAALKASSGTQIAVVFSGSCTGEIREHTFRTVMSTASEVGVAEQITYLGYVPDADMPAIYSGAEALIMPTFFGPTNIPVLEAWTAGCPVLTSNIRGVREQAGAAALLVDPASIEAIAAGMRELWTNEVLRTDLIRTGLSRVVQFSREAFFARFQSIVRSAGQRLPEESVELCITL